MGSVSQAGRPKTQARAYDRTVFVVWLALMVSTGVSWYLGDGHGPAQVATIVILVVSFFKIFLIGHYFMELREAPPILRWLYHGWVAAICVTLVVLYLVLPH